MNKIEQNILDILKQGKLDGLSYFLPQIQLDRKDYMAVNEVLENAGGKWDRKTKSHIFQNDPSEKLGLALETGITVNKKKELQFFETPAELADRMVELAEIKDQQMVLEPSAGHGAIAEAIARNCKIDIGLIMVEIDPEKCTVLDAKKIGNVLCEDFMGSFAKKYGKFDRVIMNPPFTKNQDINHVVHAYENCLENGGTLVSIMSPHFTFAMDKKSVAFKKLVDENGYWEKLPESTFKESGTNVNTVLVVLNRREKEK